MPSRRSHVASSSLAPLSEIIKLQPEGEPWCAGYAPSQGRRCHARTNARGRRSAMMLLNEGTKDLRAGRSIDELLEDLAPHVLCTRFHQNQALDLARRWKRDLRVYLDSQAASTLPSTPVRIPSRRTDLEPTEAYLEERTAILYQRIHDAMEELKRLENIRMSQTAISTHHTDSASRDTGIRVRTTRAESTPSRNIPSRRVRTDSTRFSNQSTAIAPLPVQAQVSHQIRAVPILSSRPQDPPIIPALGSPRNSDPQNETPQTNRRDVEGECGICLCNLHSPQQHTIPDEEIEERSEESGSDDDDEQSETEYEDIHQDEELTWCKACCGINFHKACIDQWLEADQWRETNRAPTCPLCRSRWKC
ncbi:hypothetical protein N7478_009920 [Penicillium angulare]|uniref:uncharacterized protein n=1 Tax=Penicillium angulare TaxID=116970 RepID=UPI0025412C2B|nr:uncharacterized protein N7478_009920 [Penicillium angulare]KAJ5267112.1 hypothetical protein N7478_009920 [Penicillium angulare]